MIFILSSCSTSTKAEKIAVIKGRVVELNEFNVPVGLYNATVTAPDYFVSTTTDSLGEFDLSIELDEKNEIAVVTLQVSKTGYSSQSVNIQVRGGDTTFIPEDIAMQASSLPVAIIQGKAVADTGTGQFPLENVTVSFSGTENKTFTNANGEFSYLFQFDAGESFRTITIQLTKSGYKEVTLENQLIEASKVNDLGTVQMEQDTSGGPGGIGEPHYLEVINVESSHIYVKESGLPEVTFIEFNVKDNNGNIIDDQHAVDVHFEIVGGPGGGETIYPTQMRTLQGYAKTAIQAGTRAGAVQIRAWFRKDNGDIVQIKPIRVAIWGGLPDDEHFIIGVERLNIAGMVKLGLLDDVTGYVGDKYGNPCAPGTVVYYTTRWAYMEGSAATDEMGRSTVQLISAAPLPNQFLTYNQLRATPDSAITRITAHTFNENYEKITKLGRVLFSAATNPFFWVDTVYVPDVLDQNNVITFFYNWVDNNRKSKTFYYRVTDIYGNPLVGGSTIRVFTDVGSVGGDIDVRIPDALSGGPGITEFQFTWTVPKLSVTDEKPEAAVITIAVNTSEEIGNGDAAVEIKGFYDGRE